MSVVDALMDTVRAIPESLIHRQIRSDDAWEDWLSMIRTTNKRTTKTQMIRNWIGDRWDEFLNDLGKAEEVDGKLVVYRCVAVKDPERFAYRLVEGKPEHGYKGLGIYWSWSRSMAECHWRGDGREVFLRGLVNLDAIDIEGTVLANFAPSTGPNEWEIRLWEHKPVELIGIGIETGDWKAKWSDLDPGVRMTS